MVDKSRFYVTVDKSRFAAEVTKKYIQDDVEDEFGVVYSHDWKKLLNGRNLKSEYYEIKNGTEEICDNAFKWCDCLKQIIIPESVTMIGVSAFEWSKCLQQILIPNSVKLIGYGAFMHCSSLRQVTMSNSVISIGEKVFYDCKALEQITIPKSVTMICNEAFYGCSFLKQINIPDSVTLIGDSAFADCHYLQQITIPDSVSTIGKNPFVACWHLNITSNSSRFVIDNECLTDNHKIIISYFGKKMSIVIPDTVTKIEDSAFEVCSTLKHITIPETVTEIGNDAFLGCNMSEIEIPNSVKTIGDSVFSQCRYLQKITLSNSITTIGASAFYYCNSLKKITIPDSVTTIGAYAFAESALQQIIISDSVSTIMEYAFYGCQSLQQIIIPDSVTMIGEGAFSDCWNLIQIVMSNSITAIEDSTFAGCKSLKQIKIPDSVTTIEDSTFLGCVSLKPNTIPDSVKKIGKNAFYNVDDDFYNPHKKDDELLNRTLDYHTKKLMKKMVIKNFRGYEKDEVFFDDFNCIIGKNDSGKSTIFAALEWFFDANKELEVSDLYLGHKFHVQKYLGNNHIQKLNKYERELFYDISVEVYFSGVINNDHSDKDNAFLDKDGYVCIKKKMDCYRNERIDKYERITKYYIKKFSFEKMNGKALSDCKRVEQWIDIESIDNTHRLNIDLSFWKSYKLYIYTPHTSLNNYLNDFLKIKYSQSIEDIKKSMSEELSENLEDKNIFETIRFENNETTDLFVNDNLLLLSGDIPLTNRGEGFQLEIKNVIFKTLVDIKSKNHNTIFVFEEPETHLHPSAQIEMYETIKELSNNPNYQVFITTHSPYIVKQLAEDNINPIVVKRYENSKISTISKLEERVLPYISMNEMNYIAFEEPSIEYHIELFGYMQNKLDKKVKPLDKWIKTNCNSILTSGDLFYWYNTETLTIEPDKMTLPYCVRNNIDHPLVDDVNDVNKHNAYENNKKFNDKELIRRSIEIMRNAIITHQSDFS